MDRQLVLISKIDMLLKEGEINGFRRRSYPDISKVGETFLKGWFVDKKVKARGPTMYMWNFVDRIKVL
jgi:hypothetical protein